MWVGLTQSAECLKEKQTEVPQAKGNSASRLSSDLSCNLGASLSSTDLGLFSLYNHISQLFKINLSLSIYPCILLVQFLMLPRGWTLKTLLMLSERSQSQKTTYWTSLVVQWLGVCLLMQGTQVRSPVREDPMCVGAAKTTTEACALQQEKSPPGEDCAPQPEGSHRLQQRRPSTGKNTYMNKIQTLKQNPTYSRMPFT